MIYLTPERAAMIDGYLRDIASTADTKGSMSKRDPDRQLRLDRGVILDALTHPDKSGVTRDAAITLLDRIVDEIRHRRADDAREWRDVVTDPPDDGTRVECWAPG